MLATRVAPRTCETCGGGRLPLLGIICSGEACRGEVAVLRKGTGVEPVPRRGGTAPVTSGPGFDVAATLELAQEKYPTVLSSTAFARACDAAVPAWLL